MRHQSKSLSGGAGVFVVLGLIFQPDQPFGRQTVLYEKYRKLHGGDRYVNRRR